MSETKSKLKMRISELEEENEKYFMENELLKSQLEENEKIRHKSHSNNKQLRDLILKLCDIDDSDVYKYKSIIYGYKHSEDLGKKLEKEYNIVIPEWMK